jgi:arylsulfatase A-like enzyme
MNKRRIPPLPVLFLALITFINWRVEISASKGLSSEALAKDGKPNVLLVVIDTTRKDRLGCYGYGRGTTPNIDKVSADSVIFDGALSLVPMTTPSHATLMTGFYPSSHLVYRNAYSVDNKFTMLAEVLKHNGYVTAGFVSSKLVGAKAGFGQGFDVFSDIKEEGEKLYRTGDITTGEAIGWLNGNSDKSFFMFLHLYDPHLPYEPPEEFGKKFDPEYMAYLKEETATGELEEEYGTDMKGQGSRVKGQGKGKRKGGLTFSGGISEKKVKAMRNAYDGEIAFDDDCVGKVINKLKEKGIYDNTVIIVTSDHGEILYEKANYFGHHKYLYNGSVNIPLIMKFPGISPKRVVSGITGADIMPTLLAYLGIELGVEIDGISYLDMIETGNKSALPESYFIFSHTSDGLRLKKPGEPGDKKGGRPPKDHIFFVQAFNHAALVEDGFKLIITREEDKPVKPELYDLSADPLEEHDLTVSSAHTTILEKLLKRMEGYFRSMSGVLIKRISRKDDNADAEKIKSLGYL